MTSYVSYQLPAHLPCPVTVIHQYTKTRATQHIASHFCAVPMCACLLQSLNVGYNQFSGSFNSLLGNCEYIVSFQADGNMLSGPLPANMASLGLMVCHQTACHFVSLVTLHLVHAMGLPERMSCLSLYFSSPCHVYLGFAFRAPGCRQGGSCYDH